MAQVINTNIPSLNAQRNLNTSQSALATSLQRLSSGLRINSAKDDAAGLAISDRMTSQINGLNQAIRNANDGVSLAQTAEGALGSSSTSLQRLRELAVQSANATNVSTDRASLNAEAQQLLAEIQRVATTTQFNGQNILDGSFLTAQFQVGANANQTISASIGNGQTSALGAYQYNNTSSAVNGVTALSSGDLTVNGVNVGASTSGSADTMVTAINSVTSQTGVTASAATSTAALASNATPTGKIDLISGDLVINGTNIGAQAGSYNLVTQGANIAAKINLTTNTHGVTAAANAATGAITLSSSTGRSIVITSGSDAGASRVLNATGLGGVSASSVQAKEDITLTGTKAVSVGTVAAFGSVVDGQTFTVGSKIYEFNLAATNATLLGNGHTAVGNAGVAYAAQGTVDTNVINAINDTTNGSGNDVIATTTGATNVTITNKFLGKEAALATNTSEYLSAGSATGMAVTSNTAGTGITAGATLVLDGTTYTFTKAASSGNGISLTQAGSNAAALVLAAAALNTAINAGHTANTTDVTSVTDGISKVTVTADVKGTPGNAVVTPAAVTGLTLGVNTAGTDAVRTTSSTYGIISLTSNSAYSVAGNNPGLAGLSTASSTLNAISSIDISSVTGANAAISLLDGALAQVSTIRGSLGALQNRFESTVASLSSTSINLSAARSRIIDTDFAAETASLTRNQILQQAGVAMLAQANALPNTVLSLLK